MSNLQIKLSTPMKRRLRELAKREEITVNQFIASAIAEKIAALQTADYLKKQAAGISRKRFEEALAKVPDVSPMPGDELPE